MSLLKNNIFVSDAIIFRKCYMGEFSPLSNECIIMYTYKLLFFTMIHSLIFKHYSNKTIYLNKYITEFPLEVVCVTYMYVCV